MARATARQAAELLGVSYRTILRYQREYRPGGRKPHFPKADADGRRAQADLEWWARERQDTAGAARLLAVAKASIYRYAQQPGFPSRGEDGNFDRAELLAWDRKRPGRGAPGAMKRRDPHPCEVCREPTLRRTRDEIDGLLKCKPCYTTPSQLA